MLITVGRQRTLRSTREEAQMSPNGRRGELKRPPGMGEMKRVADAQALTLRPELRAVMAAKGYTVEDIARLAKLDVESVMLFLEGASLNPRWQAKLSAWIERAYGDSSA
jgi:hypothetical protein